MSNDFKWEYRFIDLAKFISCWSKDPSTKVGAVIVDSRNRIVSVGYNGFPVGIEDSQILLNSREMKYKKIVHAEANSILFANKSLDNCSLYCFPMFPCSNCCALIIQSGIRKIIAPLSTNPRWIESINLSIEMCEEAGVEYKLIDCRFRI